MKKISNREVIEQILCWREAYLSGATKKDFIQDEVEDLIDNIALEGHDCYASFMFNGLTNKDKLDITTVLETQGIYLNFDDLACIYDTAYFPED